MSVSTRIVDYDIGGQTYEGYLALPDGGPAPLVVIAHAWAGPGDFERGKAEWLASKGYAGFALDVYGKGKRGTTVEENQALMNPLAGNRAELQARLKGGLETAAALSEVDGSKAAAIGFCFGGLCVLDMARANMDVAGVASFHGLFMKPDNIDAPKIKPKVLALHGWDDPMAKPEDALGFATEMTEAGADWQLHAYGGTMHAFTNPDANDPNMGTVYSADADRRSFETLENFLAALF